MTSAIAGSDQYTARDTAVNSGVSPTVVRGGAVLLQNVVSFYRPDNVADTSNGYRSMRNISILQNILNDQLNNFRSERWQGISIVSDVALVSNSSSRQKARDINSVLDDDVALAYAWGRQGLGLLS